MTLTAYLKALGPTKERDAFVRRSKTSLQYLRHLASKFRVASFEHCVNIEKASHGMVRCETLRPDIDWSYLRRR